MNQVVDINNNKALTIALKYADIEWYIFPIFPSPASANSVQTQSCMWSNRFVLSNLCHKLSVRCYFRNGIVVDIFLILFVIYWMLCTLVCSTSRFLSRSWLNFMLVWYASLRVFVGNGVCLHFLIISSF